MTEENVYFRDTYAFTKEGTYSKMEVIEGLRHLRSLACKRSIKKIINENGKLIYKLKLDKIKIRISIPKKCIKDNIEIIKELDNLVKRDKIDALNELKKLAITSALTLGITVTAYEPIKEALEKVEDDIVDIMTDEVGILEREIRIHSGTEITDDGRTVSPFLPHDCALDSNKDLSIEEKIQKYCEEHDLQYMTEIALEKYSQLSYGNIDFGNSIDLKEIEEEYKESQKVNKKN